MKMAPMKNSTNLRVTRSSLLAAVENGKISTIKIIISRGGNVNAKDKLDQTALHVAAFKGNVSIVKLLLQSKAKITFKDYHENIPLHLASENGHLGVVKLLLNNLNEREKSTMINKQNLCRKSPLHLAALKGHSKVVKYLLQHGAHMNAQTNSGDSPLHLAAAEGHPKVVRELLNFAADVNIINQCYLTPLHVAVLNQSYLNPKTMSHKSAPKLTEAQLHKYVEVVHALISNGANVNAEDDSDSTPLHYAAEKDQEILVRSLINHGAEVNVRNSSGKTPLMMAAVDGSPAVIRHLMNSGADIHATSSIGVAAISYAVFGQNEKVIWMLACAGADINQTYGDRGQTIMHIFAFLNPHPRPSLIDVIFESGADVNARESVGSLTPFHIMCTKNYSHYMTSYLYDQFIDDFVISPDGDQHSFLDFLIFGPFPNIQSAEALVKFFAKKNVIDGLQINYKNLIVIYLHFLELYMNCIQELKLVKNVKVMDSITLYDLLTKPIGELAAYTRNEVFMQALESCNYKENFTYYLDWFEHRIERATERRDLFRLGTRVLSFLINPTLPHVVCYHILGFINLIDLRNLSMV